MDPYVVFDIEVNPAGRDILLAFLAELPFDSFEETPEGLVAYLRPGADPEQLEPRLRRLQTDHPFAFRRRLISAENWNALWESQFQPIRVGQFCGVRADFHYPLLDVQHEIVITPRMTFGTGHHETTYMMMEAMEKLDLKEGKVLDFGCGTGVLAILAARMGATMVEAVDIEAEAYHNALHNLQINDIDSVQVLHGGLEAVLDRGYRVILANINRNVLMASLPTLYDKLARPGTLLLSGILHDDLAAITGVSRPLGFRVDSVRRRGEWACLTLRAG